MKLRFQSAWTLVPAALLLFVLAVPLGAVYSAIAEPLPQNPVQAQDPAAPEAPQAYLTSEVPTRAEELEQQLTAIGQVIDVDPDVTGVDEALPDAEAEIDADYAVLEALNPETVLRITVEDQQQRWLLHQRALATPLEMVTARYASLENQRVELQGSELRWRETLDQLDAEEQPEEVKAPLRDRIEQVLTSIDAMQERLQTRSAAVLAIQSRVSSLDTRVTEALNRANELEAAVRQRVLAHHDSVPLWQAGIGEVGELVAQAREAMDERRRSIAAFYRSDPDGAGLQALIFLVFVAAGYALRRQVPRWKEIEGTEALVHVVSRPISGAAIFTLLLTGWIYSAVPTSVVDLMLLATVIPVLRLAPGLVRAVERASVYRLLGLYVALKVLMVTPEGSLLRRLVLLIVAVLGFAGLITFVRSNAAAFTEGRSMWWRFASVLKRLALVFLASAILLDIVGWTQLAEVLFSGTVQSGYAAIILLVFTTAACGLVAIAPTSRVGDWLPSIRRNSADFTRVAVVLIHLYALWTWLDATATWFLLGGPIARRWNSFRETNVGFGGLEAITIDHLLSAVVILLLTPLVSRLVRFFFMEEIRPRMSLPRGSAVGVASLIHYVIVTLGILLAAAAAGLGGTQLAVVFGALGVGIGFGLQNITNNFISGLILIFERPITVGDRITVGAGEMGTVTRIGIRASTVRTFDGAEVVVPNGDLISKEVTNWTLTDMTRRIVLEVGVEYGTDPRQVNDMLRTVAVEHPDVLDDPEPMGIFVDFAESCLMFRLLYWVPGEDILRIKNEINLAVHDSLAEAGIRVPFPQRVIWTAGDPREGDGLTGGD